MKQNMSLWVVLLIVVCGIACKSETASPNTAPTPASTAIHLDSTNSVTGRHIVDKDGKSLYYFSNDANGQSNCTGGCLTLWPIFYADSLTTTYGTGLSPADFKTILLSSGAKQTTYKGWPLYYYAPNGVTELPGQTTGEGVGNIWFVAKNNYTITISNFQLTGSNAVNYLGDYTPGNGLTSYLSDEKGNTLYAFAKDSANKNKFTKADFSNNDTWPIYENENIIVPSILDKSLFVVAVFNGKKQLTYKGWPLYYYGADNKTRGSNKGFTIPLTQPVGSTWQLVKKDRLPAPTP